MPTLSVIIITKNEAHDIGDCLASVKWADEIIVVDSGSTDNTVEICLQYTNKVFVTDWPGYGKQKNRALSYATSDWVLSLDADERVTDELQKEILSGINQISYSAFAIPRKSNYCGYWIRYGAWGNKPVVRLFQRTKAKFNDAAVHEAVIVDGKIGLFSSPILHYTYATLEEMLEKNNSYSSISALEKYKQGKKGSLNQAMFHGFWAFFKSYFVQKGFLDGKAGFMLAISNAGYAYYRYLKLMLLVRNEKDEK